MDIERCPTNLQTQIIQEKDTDSNLNLLEQINTDINKALFTAELSLSNYPEYCWTTEIDNATKVIQYWAAE
eukprot:14575001-Ditylum_brightwellii.AAC.1